MDREHLLIALKGVRLLRHLIMTPLKYLALIGHLDAAKLLIEKYGADKKAQNEHGQVALELVYEQTPEWEKVFGVVSYLLDRAAQDQRII